MSTQHSLAADDLHVWRGDRHVLRGVQLVVAAGELLHVSGPNGAGKSTLLRVLTGLLRPEQGTVRWAGRPLHEDTGAYHGAMTYSAHEPALKGDLTALENLKFAVGLRRPAPEPELADALERCGVAACAHLPARVLSAGQRRRVALARVVASRVPLWLLDEPLTNLDTAGVALTQTLLAAHVERGGLAVVVAHQPLALDGVRRLELAT